MYVVSARTSCKMSRSLHPSIFICTSNQLTDYARVQRSPRRIAAARQGDMPYWFPIDLTVSPFSLSVSVSAINMSERNCTPSLSIVRDATSRLPNGEGTRLDVS